MNFSAENPPLRQAANRCAIVKILKMIKILTIILIVVFTSCQNSERTNNETDSHISSPIADSLYSVVEYDQATSYPFEEGEPTILSIAEIKEVEQILERAVKENNDLQKEN